MKFSALTTQDLRQAYDNLLPKLDFELVDSGIARHVLDWYWGMNLSVHSDEDLVLREDGIIKIVKIGEFVDQFFERGEGEIKVPSKFGALCFSPSGKLEFNPIKAVIRHASPGKMIGITLQGGRKIRVTKSHSLFTLKRGRIEPVQAGSLEIGSYLVAPGKMPPSHSFTDINLERWGREKGLYVDGKVVRPSSASRGQGRKGSKPSWELPARLPIIPELMRLLGYFCSEGSYGTGIFISNSNQKTVEDIIHCANRVFLSGGLNKKRRITVHTDKRDGSKDIIFGGKISVLAFQEFFQVPAGAGNKRIPWIVFNVPYELQLEFLKGLFAGDGSLSYNQTTGECALYLSTKSKRLASELAYLLTQIGVTPAIIPCKGERFFHVSIASKASLRKLLDLVPANYRERVVRHVNDGRESPKIVIPLQESALGEALESIGIHHETRWKKGVSGEYFKSLLTKLSKKGINTERFLPLVNNLIFPRITRVEEIPPSRYVYDISVEGYENFVCGFGGVCAHNSRAMSAAVESAYQRFAKLSAGRVQTPTLKVLVEREREIKAFKPEPFWVISLLFELEGQEVVAEHATPRFFDKKEAENVRDVCKDKKAKVSAIQTRQYQLRPPIPFNLGTLQAEAYRCFGYTPMRTQQIAQQLYDAAYISYPRTSNQKFPPTIDLAAILKQLRGISTYKNLVDALLEQPWLTPTEGTKTDPAHPPIHPTGEKPGRLIGPQQRLYDLIVRRFLSIFGKPALKESIRVELDVDGQPFYIRGRRILDESWLAYYGPYGATEEVTLPALSEGQQLTPKELRFEEKETQPPPRYNPASIVKVMEEKNLGTKSTRAPILQTLYERGYIFGNQIVVTDIGMEVVDSLSKHCPEIVSEELTAHFESEMEKIQEGTTSKDNVIAEAREKLDEMLGKFKNEQDDIGKNLGDAYAETKRKQRVLGACAKCGGELRVIVSRATHKRFAGCSNYPNCKNAFPLPQAGFIVSLDKKCEHCAAPMIQVNRAGMRPYRMCLEPKCESKKDWGKKKKAASKIRKEESS
jgi:DNA topoisomerase-1